MQNKQKPSKQETLRLSQLLSVFGTAADFQKYFIEDCGQVDFQETQCEDVPVQGIQDNLQKQSDEQEDFYLEGDEPQSTQPQAINNYQFLSGMFAPSNACKSNKETPKLDLQQMLVVAMGYNSQYNSTIAAIGSQLLCLGLGNSVLLRSSPNNKTQQFIKIYNEHRFQISHIYYHSESNQIFTGSLGTRPEILIWEYCPKNCALTLSKKLQLPRVSKGVGSLLKIEDCLLCIDTTSLHKTNYIYRFNLNQPENSRHIGEALKLQAKLLDYLPLYQTNQLLLLTEKGLRKSNFSKFGSDAPIMQSLSQQQKLSCICRVTWVREQHRNMCEWLCGTRDGTIYEPNSHKSMTQVHHGWVLHIQTARTHDHNNYIITSGGHDKMVNITQVDYDKFIEQLRHPQPKKDGNPLTALLKGKKQSNNISLKHAYTLNLSSYVTTMRIDPNCQILIGCRNGTILSYDLTQMSIKYKIQFAGSHTAHHLDLLSQSCYCQQAQIIVVPQIQGVKQRSINKLIAVNITPNKATKIKTHRYIEIKTKFSTECFTLNDTKIVQILTSKQSTHQNKQIYPILIRDLNTLLATGDHQDTQKLGSSQLMLDILKFAIDPTQLKEDLRRARQIKASQEYSNWRQYEVQHSYSQSDVTICHLEIQKQYGRPCLVRYLASNRLLLLVGTSSGHLITHDIKQKTICSRETHASSVEDMTWAVMMNKQVLVKSVSGCELFYWVVKDSGEIEKIDHRTKRLKDLKNAQWQTNLKYGWESRSIWQSMTHYQDICSVAVIESEYLAVSLYDGHLRIYNYPVTQDNAHAYQQWKLFDSGFKVGSCGNKRIFCLWRGTLLILDLSR